MKFIWLISFILLTGCSFVGYFAGHSIFSGGESMPYINKTISPGCGHGGKNLETFFFPYYPCDPLDRISPALPYCYLIIGIPIDIACSPFTFLWGAGNGAGHWFDRPRVVKDDLPETQTEGVNKE